MKKLFILAAAILLTMTAFAAEAQEAPVFSVPSGVYEAPFSLTISGQGDIYYTTDGSLPTTSSIKYTGPISVTSRTTSVQGGPMASADSVLPAGTVIRAAVISYGQSSEVITNTYFIGSGFQSYYGNIPIVNLAVTPYDLWDRNDGIYSNYNYEHKVPGSFQYYNLQGGCDINRSIEVKVSGHGSRANPKKSLRVYFKNTDPAQGKYLEYPLIPGNLDRGGSPITTYSKVTFRVSDWQITDLRDVFAQKLGEDTLADTAASTPMALFLNGEYWGMYECREQYDDDYVAAHYGLDHDDVVFLDRDWTLPPQYDALSDTGTVYVDKIEYSSGPNDDNIKGRLGESYYRDQWRYVQSLVLDRDIARSAVYAEFCANVDVDDLIDYMIVYIFAGNDDWPGNNFKLWRVTEENIDPAKYGADGKWRFMIHDFDIAFENAWHNTLDLSAFGVEPDTEARHPAYATRFFAGLLKNSEFRSKFAQRTIAYLSTRMSESSARAIVDSLVAQRREGKTADLLRWGWGPADQRLNSWINAMDGFVRFASQRKDVLISQYTDILNNKFAAGISGQGRIQLISAPADGGAPVNYYVGGGYIGGGAGKIYSVFSGIPLTVGARADDSQVLVTVTHRGEVLTGLGEVTFTPQLNEPYTVTAQKLPDAAAVQPVPIGIARSDRFANMSVGERLPAILIGAKGERLTAQYTVTGDCASVENGMVKALLPGIALLKATYNGGDYYVNIFVK